MPKFDFKCDKCNSVFEDWVPLSKMNEPVPCNCGGRAVRLPHYQSVTIGIPAAFFTSESMYPSEPQNEEERKHWDAVGATTRRWV